jgi:hypothetical protein
MSLPVSLAGAAIVERLPGLFDRRFVVSALLPAFVFAAASSALASSFGLVRLDEVWLSVTDSPIDAVLPLVGVWLLAVSLVAANTFVIRRLEGYGPWRRLPWLMAWERAKLERLCRRIEGSPPDAVETRRLACLRATLYPPREEELLPTAFGNVVRAFESYPSEVYGFEATRGWTRLLAVMPQAYREIVADTRSQVDFLANLWALSCAFFVEYFVFGALAARSLDRPEIPLLALTSAWVTARYARLAAIRWGEVVKGGFDVFLPELRRRLGLPGPRSRREERETWEQLSEAFLTRDPDYLPPLTAAPDAPAPGPGGEGYEGAEHRRGLRPV